MATKKPKASPKTAGKASGNAIAIGRARAARNRKPKK